MRFRVLGPLEAYEDGGLVGLGPARQRTVLAALPVEPGRPVTLDQLMDRVWGDRPPQRVRLTLHGYLSRLRTLLGAAGGPALARRSNGYVLEVDPAAVDLHRFRALVRQAGLDDDETAVATWRDALALWRGTPFADLDSEWLRTVVSGLERERLAAVLDRNDVLLRHGEHAGLLPGLTASADLYPLDERLAGQLIVALYRCGRQADALAQYRRLRDRLVNELGSDPGPALQDLHQRILRHDPGLATSTAIEAVGGPLVPVGLRPSQAPDRPAQLPAEVPSFIGRTADLERLDELLDGAVRDQASHAVTIAVIGGTAGVGKTALAVHWAQRAAARFPDGQLYVNLRGYDPRQPMSPDDALSGFLTALEVSGENMPIGLAERAARYRSELAGRRMLVLLDNAASAAQVRPLLPGTGSCLVVVTSRDSMAGLVAVDGALRLDLDLLRDVEAISLMRHLIGDRVDDEPAAAAALAEQCARLPVALRVAAELAVSRPHSALAELVAELADQQARLDLLDAGGDPYAAVREVFSWSLPHLPPDAVRTFQLWGLHAGPDLDVHSVAALRGGGLDQARRTIEILARAHLVHRSGRGRYGMHDLLHAFATHLASTELTGQQRRAAQQRLHALRRTFSPSAAATAEAIRSPHLRHRSAPARDPIRAGTAIDRLASTRAEPLRPASSEK